jgi:hypothetical protein
MSREGPRTGLTWRVILVLLYGAFLIAPMDLFLSLNLGASYLTGTLFGMLAPPALFIVLILFTEVARFYGKPFNVQEVFLMYNLLGVSMSAVFFSGFLYQGYFRVAPVTREITDPHTQKTLLELLPSWYTPPESSIAARTFLEPGWLPVIGVALAFFVCYLMFEVGLGLLLSYMFVQEEKLPFPTAPVDSSAIQVLAQRDPTRTRVFSLATIIGALWSSITFGTPSVLGGAFGIRVGAATFIDITPWLSKYIQGPVMGITFELFPYTFAWIWLDPAPVISMVVASYAIWVFGNAFALKLPWELLKEFQLEYTPAMTMDLLMWRSWLWIWASFVLGAGLGVAVVSLIRSRRYLINSIRSLSKVKGGSAGGYPPLSLILLAWLGGGIGAVVLTQVLIPNFPIWVTLVFMLLVPFINATVNARGRGEVGVGVSLPYMKESMIIASGYRGVDIWLSHVYYWGWGMGNNAANYCYISKVASLTGTNVLDYFKGLFIILPVVWATSFIATSLFWRMAPIPSEVFTMTTKLWPEQIVQQAFTMLNYEKIYKVPLLATGFGIFAALTVLKSFVAIPYFDVLGLLAGLGIAPHYANALLIGFLLGNYVLRRRLGEEWWNNYRLTFLAGLAAGHGIIAAVIGGIVLISKALWYTQAVY